MLNKIEVAGMRSIKFYVDNYRFLPGREFKKIFSGPNLDPFTKANNKKSWK